MTIVAILVALVIWNRWTAPRGGAPSSIAVLPFADLSPDHSNAYLGDGIAETLINALVNVPGLSVTARTSAFAFRGREADVREIGKQLNVGAVLEGSVQRAGDQLRVTAQLIRTADGVNLWSERFDRPAAEIFAVQDEVARSALSALKLALAPGTAPGGSPGGTRNPEAYEAYLLGRYHWNLRTTDGMIHATEAFLHAVALDSTYALGWAGLADAYELSIPSEYNVPGLSEDSLLTLSERAARRAVSLAPNLGEAHVSLGEVLDSRNRWTEATAAFEEGIRLSPNYATGHQWYAYHLQAFDRWDEAIREMETAHRLDPLSHVTTLSLAGLYDGADRFAEATPLYGQGLAQSPEAWYAWGMKIGHELALGHMDQAVAAYGRWLIGIGEGSASASRREREVADPATRAAAIDWLVREQYLSTAIAFIRWLQGDEAVLAVLERVTSIGRGSAPTVILYTMLGPGLRANPRLRALATKLGGPPL